MLCDRKIYNNVKDMFYRIIFLIDDFNRIIGTTTKLYEK